MAALYDTMKKDIFCGASIIAPAYIITSSHCVDGLDLKTDKVCKQIYQIAKGVMISPNSLKSRQMAKNLTYLFGKLSWLYRVLKWYICAPEILLGRSR